MPHDTHKGGTELYLETLHELQGLLDNCGNAPYVVVGDFNTRLPWSEALSPKWYKGKGFSKHSVILFDFIADNECSVANFSFTQPVNYTYSNSVSKSYIDHVLAPTHLLNIISTCAILCDDTNVSDHFPIRCHVKLKASTESRTTSAGPRPSRVRWDSQTTQRAYRDTLE